MVTEVPPAVVPDVGETLVNDGAEAVYVYVPVAVPPGVVITMLAAPAVPAGVVAVIEVALLTVNVVGVAVVTVVVGTTVVAVVVGVGSCWRCGCVSPRSNRDNNASDTNQRQAPHEENEAGIHRASPAISSFTLCSLIRQAIIITPVRDGTNPFRPLDHSGTSHSVRAGVLLASFCKI